MRWSGQEINGEQADALPGLARLNNLVRTVRTPEFAGITFYEVVAKSALNKVPGGGSGADGSGGGANGDGATSKLPFGWTVNPMRGCQHACAYCFARPTHGYLDFDAGRDFDTQIIVKVNVAEVLARELAKPAWTHAPVALGTNTDPYQRAEGRYRLMPGIIAALAYSGTPFSILTKGTLLRRDIPLLVEASSETTVDVALSVAIFDDELQKSVEPGTPTAAARLATVTAVREAGLDCSVFMMPILPFLTDTTDHLDDALRRVREAGATSVLYSSMYLKPGTKEWFMQWLERAHPELVGKYRDLYSRGAYAPIAYRTWLAERIQPLIRRHGLERGRENPVTGGLRSRALVGDTPNAADAARRSAGRSRLIAEELPVGMDAAALQPTLF